MKTGLVANIGTTFAGLVTFLWLHLYYGLYCSIKTIFLKLINILHHLQIELGSLNQSRRPWTYVVACGATAGKDSGVAFTVRCGLEALPCFDLCQQL